MFIILKIIELEAIATKKQLYDFKNKHLSENLQENICFFKSIFSKDDVFRIRNLHISQSEHFDCAALFMDGMINAQLLNESVIRPLLVSNVNNVQSNIVDYIEKQILFANEVSQTNDIEKMFQALLYGDTVLIIDGFETCLIINSKGWRTRGISEPTDERILQGPREGFDEALMMNVALIRRKLPTPDLCVELTTVGRKTDTKIFICYLDSLVNKHTLKKIKKKINSIDIDGVLDSNYINEMIKTNKYSLFKTIGSTERPDIVAARLLEGRIAILVDGTPVVLTIPYLFIENFQSDDDYYLNFWISSIGRILRFVCFFLAISVPAIYIALISFHPQLLPTSFAISISTSRGGIPFPSFIECLMLIFVFEILKETGVRMQQSVGHALSIVGGLVVGQAAVEAKIVSAPMLIVVALSGIAGLMIPRLKGVVFYYRIILVVLSSMLGLFGYFIGMIIFQISIFSINSFGVDYTDSLSRFNKESLKDSLIRVPWWDMKTRPKSLTKNIVRFRKKG